MQEYEQGSGKSARNGGTSLRKATLGAIATPRLKYQCERAAITQAFPIGITSLPRGRKLVGGRIVKKNLLFYVYSTGIHRIHQHIRSHINRFHWEVIRKIKCLKIFLRGGDYEKKIEKDCLVKGLCHLTKPMALCRGIRWQQPA